MANHATRTRATRREKPVRPNTVVGRKAEKLATRLDDTIRNIALKRDPSLIPLIVVDLFCGAGGASQGLLRALEFAGLTPERLAELGYYLKLICVNHWEIAIETIRRNIAFAEMYNASIENWDPQQILNGQRPHLLIFAPECIAHSYAKGKGPIKDQSRTTAAWVLDWIKTQPHALYAENVWPWTSWGPLDRKGDPIKERQGEYFNSFVEEIRSSGYKSFRYGKFTCANWGDPTTRERLFATAWHDEYEARVPFPSETHTEFPERYPHLLPWVPASACIDFNRKSDYITERNTVHAPTTIRRIRAGFDHQDAFDSPLLVEITHRVEPIAERAHNILNARPSEAMRKREARALGKRVPKNTKKYRLNKDEKKENKRILDEVRANTYDALIAAAADPLAYFDPKDVPEEVFLALEAIIGQHAGSIPRTVSEPLMAIEARGAIGLAQGRICKANASEKSTYNDAVQDPANPFNSIVAKDCRAFAQPSLVVVRHGKDDIRVPNASEPFGVFTAKNELGISQSDIALSGPAILNLYSSNVTEDGAAARAVTLPTKTFPTVLAGGNHHALTQTEILAAPVVTRCYGEKKNGENRTRPTTSPLGTLGAQGNQHGLAQSMIDLTYTGHNNIGGNVVSEPMNALLGVNHYALAQPAIVPQHFDAEPQTASEKPTPTVVAIARIGLSQSSIIPQHANANPRTASKEPVTTIMTEARIGLAQSALISRNGTTEDRAPRPTTKPMFTATADGGGNLAQPTIKPTNNVIPLSEAFLTPNFGERPTQEPRTHSIAKPAPAITGHGAGMLVDKDFDANGNPLKIMFHFYIGTTKIWINIRYRMLHSSELKKAHSLDDVVFAGTETDAIRQIGNSIPARTAAAFIAHTLTPVFARMQLPALLAA